MKQSCLNAEVLAEQLATSIGETLRDAVSTRGRALMAVSGGNSPKKLFERLSSLDLPWTRITVTQVDERWIPTDHPDSNARLIREHLLRNAAATAHFVPMKNSAGTASEGRAACESMLRMLGLPFDIIVLGMGEDAHTASLFPNIEELTSALQAEGPLCTAVRAPGQPHPPHPRMSLTLAGLLASRRLILPLSGEAKVNVLLQALEDGPTEAMPIRAVLRQRHVPLEVWTSP